MRAISVILAVVVCLFTGCRRESAPQAGAKSPRLVVFSPAVATMLFDMGLGDHVVGVSEYCPLPAGQKRPVVGSNLSVRVEPILSVSPDAVLVQMDRRHFEPLMRAAPNVKVEHFQIEVLSDIPVAMRRLGTITGSPSGERAAHDFEREVSELTQQAKDLSPVPCAFVVGTEKPLACGQNTFINDMVRLAGGDNLPAARVTGWQPISVETLEQLKPAVIICHLENGNAEAARAYWNAVMNGRGRVVVLTDPKWTLPGAHSTKLARLLRDELHPGDRRP